jgi:hypothetical protein
MRCFSKLCAGLLTPHALRNDIMFDEPRYRPLAWAVSLPLVVAVVWVVLVLLAEHHRDALVAQLSDVAAHGNTDEAAAAVRQLAGMPHPPVELLVAAATSPTREVASEAQSAINDLVRRVADQLTTLVDALARHQAAFSLADYPWLGRITRRTLRLANQFPAAISLPVTPQCEAILAGVESADASVAAFTAVLPAAPADAGIAAALAATAPAADSRIPRPFAPRTNTLGVLGDDAVESAEHSGVVGGSPDPAAPVVRGSPDPAPVARSADRPPLGDSRSEIAFVLPYPVTSDPPGPPSASLGSLGPSDVNPTPSDGDQPTTTSGAWPAAPDGSAFGESGRLGWRPRRFQPAKADASAESSPATADGRPLTGDVLTPVAIAPDPKSAASDGDGPLASLETRSLLARWLAADAASALELEGELARRGFGRLSAELVSRFLSPDVQSRRSLVADLLAQPGVDARPWLILLASDEEAEVRLAAVSTMATSHDPQLIEEAWQVALHDRDPRIADLVPRLRARHASLQQR